MDYNNWIREDLIAEINALNNAMEKRIIERVATRVKKEREQIKSQLAELTGLMKDAAQDKVAVLEKLAEKRSDVRSPLGWHLFASLPINHIAQKTIPFDVAYYLPKAVKAVKEWSEV